MTMIALSHPVAISKAKSCNVVWSQHNNVTKHLVATFSTFSSSEALIDPFRSSKTLSGWIWSTEQQWFSMIVRLSLMCAQVVVMLEGESQVMFTQEQASSFFSNNSLFDRIRVISPNAFCVILYDSDAISRGISNIYIYIFFLQKAGPAQFLSPQTRESFAHTVTHSLTNCS